MGVKDFFESCCRQLKKLFEYRFKNEFEIKIENIVEDISKFLNNNLELEKENSKLKEIIKTTEIKEIDKSSYLWNYLGKTVEYPKEDNEKSLIIEAEKNWVDIYTNILQPEETKIKNIFELDVKDINWVNCCNVYDKAEGRDSLDSYVEKNSLLIYFLMKDKESFSKSIRNKIEKFDSKNHIEEVLKKFDNNEINEIINFFNNYECGSKSFSRNREKIQISLNLYDNSIEWVNNKSVHTHHFLVMRWILKKINRFDILKNPEIWITYLNDSSIKMLFDKLKIFLISYDKKLLEHLVKVPNIKIKALNLSGSSRLIFFVGLLKSEKIHKNLITNFEKYNFYNLEKYYKKYLKEQDKNLKSYIEKKWIKKEEIEKIEGLELI